MSAELAEIPLFRRLSPTEWAVAARPDTPALPWLSADGRRIVAFRLVPIPECPTGNTVMFLDAEGHTIEVRNDGPHFEAVQALGPRLGELTLLPD
jgi:hypothetical protein